MPGSIQDAMTSNIDANLDTLVNDMMKNASGPSRRSEMSDKERMDDFMSTPLFMNNLGSEKDVENNQVLSALQALAFDGTPNEIAENFKNQGNDWFKKGKIGYDNAIQFYTKAIKAGADDTKLNSVLYSNRAAVHLDLRNFRQVLNDCAKAISFNPDNIKAYFRSTKALLSLDRIEEGLDCAEKGLQRDPENISLQQEKKKLLKRKTELEDLAVKQRLKDEAKLLQERMLLDTLRSRGYKLKAAPKSGGESSDEEDNDDSPSEYRQMKQLLSTVQHPLAPSQRLHYDQETQQIVFPVLFLYPEHNQSDLITEFREEDTFFQHYHSVFAEPASWDATHEYTPETLDLYFEVPSSKPYEKPRLVSVLKEVQALSAPSQTAAHRYVYTTLKDVLQHESFHIVGGICSFIILARGSSFALQFKKQYQ